MNENIKILRLGSRGSDLALWQTYYVRDLLQAAWPGLVVEIEILSTKGDQILDKPLPLIGGKGLFTAELEAALHNGTIDAAVHSLKDLPTEMPDGLAIGAIPARANPADVLISRRGFGLESLPAGATVGTSSHRRAAQLLRQRPDLQIADLRGNVPTRIRKALDADGPYDAIVLAYAGLERLNSLETISQVLSLEQMLPAPGQGALAIECRDGSRQAWADSVLEIFAPLDDAGSRASVTAERSFLSVLGGGCSLPIAAFGALEAGAHLPDGGPTGRWALSLRGRVSALDGSRQIDVQGTASAAEAVALGAQLARQALTQGAAELLEDGA